MHIRKLALFFPDDRHATMAPASLIEQVNETPFIWSMHCIDAASRKQLRFDLMSADVNFELDETDPERGATEKKHNSAGLIHALMGIARREVLDGHRNRLPLAWEVRTMSPTLYSNDPHATRVYGLLRALAANPNPGETLPQCIRREYQDRHDRDGERAPLPETKSIRDIVTADLAQQPQQSSEAMDAVRRLLPEWRTRFLAAVDSGEVRIHVNKARAALKRIKKQVGPLPIADDGSVAIPIADEAGRAMYGISLFSAMADLVEEDRLDLASDSARIRISGVDHASVTLWYETVITAATGQWKTVDNAEQLARVGHLAEEYIRNKELAVYFKSLDRRDLDRGLLFLTLVARETLKNRLQRSIKQLAIDYGFDEFYNEQTFARPLRRRESVFPQVGGPSELAAELTKALHGDDSHRLGDHWSWIKAGLKNWYDVALRRTLTNDAHGVDIDVAQHRAPGLFR